MSGEADLFASVAQIIFDVGHQAYGHKILTGRRERMHTIRQTGGLSGNQLLGIWRTIQRAVSGTANQQRALANGDLYEAMLDLLCRLSLTSLTRSSRGLAACYLGRDDFTSTWAQGQSFIAGMQDSQTGARVNMIPLVLAIAPPQCQLP